MNRSPVFAACFLILVALGLALGCASSPPYDQRFVEVRTPNFTIASSFGETATRTLARDLETFHAGVLFALGLPQDTTPRRPTRVIGFDGRGLVRPFAIRGEPAYLLSTLEGPVLVLRALGSLADRVDSDLRHQYAHHVLRSASANRPPLWYEEGRAQIAGSVEVRGTIARIGRIPGQRAKEMLSWRNTRIAEVFEVRDLGTQTLARRRAFADECWAIVHHLLFGGASKKAGAAALERIWRASEAEDAEGVRSATLALGDSASIATRVYDHLDLDRQRTERIQVVGFEGEALELRSLSSVDARILLGELAASLDRPSLAFEYFDRAFDHAPQDPRVRAGRNWALARAGETAEASGALLELQAERRAHPVESLVRQGLAWIEVASAESAPAAKKKSLSYARVAFQAALAADSDSISARVGLGRVALLDASHRGEGAGVERALEAFERAALVAPGVLEVDLMIAEAEASRGRRRAAGLGVATVLSRSHDPLLTRRAHALRSSLDQKDSSTTR